MKLIQKTFQKSPEKILGKIKLLRERKGQEEKVHELINEAFILGHEFIIELFWEEALLHHHKIMSEEAKPENERSEEIINKALKKWEKIVDEAKFYIEKYEITRWKSRLHRSIGRLHDHKKEYGKAIDEYKIAIEFSKRDPEYVNDKTPRWLELEAFMVGSLINSGQFKKGMEMAKMVYGKFDLSEEGKFLKSEDYPTWAIWKSGLVIRVIDGLLSAGKKVDGEMLDWLQEVEKMIEKPVHSDKWGGEMDFRFRKDEIETLKKMLV